MTAGEGLGGAAEEALLRLLGDYVAIPATSPAHDARWGERGFLLAAAQKAREWIELQVLQHARVEVDLRGPAPAVVAVVSTPAATGTVLIHGHLDKEPPVGEWSATDPYTLKRVGDRLYGLGAAEGGAALACGVLAVKALQARGQLRHRVVLLFDTFGRCAEAGPRGRYAALSELIGEPQLVLYLGAQVPDDQRLYRVTSARGALTFELSADVLKESVHSGVMGGLVPDGVQTLLKALDAFEDSATGALPPAFSVDIPVERYEELVHFLEAHNWSWAPALPVLSASGVPPLLALRRNNWEAALTVVGQRGLPPLGAASNVIRRGWTLALHLSIPPTLPCQRAQQAVEEQFLRRKQPYNAHMRIEAMRAVEGFNQPAAPAAFIAAVNHASLKHFGAAALACGSGAALPGLVGLVDLLGARPVYLASGAATFASNLGGPDQSASLVALKRLIEAYADVISAFSSA